MELEDLKEHIDTRIDGIEKLMNEKLDATVMVCRERSGNLQKGQDETKVSLDRIEGKVDAANGRSRRNALQIKGLWAAFTAGWTLFLIWFKAKVLGG